MNLNSNIALLGLYDPVIRKKLPKVIEKASKSSTNNGLLRFLFRYKYLVDWNQENTPNFVFNLEDFSELLLRLDFRSLSKELRVLLLDQFQLNYKSILKASESIKNTLLTCIIKLLILQNEQDTAIQLLSNSKWSSFISPYNLDIFISMSVTQNLPKLFLYLKPGVDSMDSALLHDAMFHAEQHGYTEILSIFYQSKRFLFFSDVEFQHRFFKMVFSGSPSSWQVIMSIPEYKQRLSHELIQSGIFYATITFRWWVVAHLKSFLK
jgi:hypothetical protein